MKRRNGFVGNSSSSCFIVAFPCIPKTVIQLKEWLFKGAVSYPDPYNNCAYSSEQVANTVFNDMQDQIKKRKKLEAGKAKDKDAVLKRYERKLAFEAIRNGWFDGRPDYDSFKKEDYKKGDRGSDIDWEAYEKASDKAAKGIVGEFLGENKDKAIFTFQYADEDGSYHCALEHGDLFQNLSHKRISYH